MQRRRTNEWSKLVTKPEQSMFLAVRLINRRKVNKRGVVNFLFLMEVHARHDTPDEKKKCLKKSRNGITATERQKTVSEKLMLL